MSSGFRITQPPAVNTNQMVSPVAATPGKTFVRTEQTGIPLPDASADIPDHDPQIPLPGVDTVKPYRNLR